MDQQRLTRYNARIDFRAVCLITLSYTFLLTSATQCFGRRQETPHRTSQTKATAQAELRQKATRVKLFLPKISKTGAKNPFLHDFGTLLEGTSPTHVFSFVNKTKSPLKILQLRVSCGCTKVKMGNKNLAPGEKTTFEVKFLTKRRSGRVAKSVYLVTDSKDTSVTRYAITAYVVSRRSPVCVAQSVINLGKIAVREKKNVEYIIENKGVSDLVVDLGSTTSFIAVDTPLPLTIKAGQNRKIKLIVKAPFYEGKLRANLMLKTNDRSKANLWILFTADIVK